MIKKNDSIRLSAAIGALGVLTLLMVSCVKTDYTPPPPTAVVNVVQASPDQAPILFYMNGNVVTQSALAYGNQTGYFSAYAGQRTANFYTATMSPILSAPVTLTANVAYSLFLANTPAKSQILLLTDTLNKPAAGYASVRFVDLSPDAPAADLAVQGGSVIVSNRSFLGYSSFVPISGKSGYTFQVLQTGTSTVLATLSNVTFEDGFVYTIVFDGLSASTSSSDKLTAQLYTNADFN